MGRSAEPNSGNDAGDLDAILDGLEHEEKQPSVGTQDEPGSSKEESKARQPQDKPNPARSKLRRDNRPRRRLGDPAYGEGTNKIFGDLDDLLAEQGEVADDFRQKVDRHNADSNLPVMLQQSKRVIRVVEHAADLFSFTISSDTDHLRGKASGHYDRFVGHIQRIDQPGVGFAVKFVRDSAFDIRHKRALGAEIKKRTGLNMVTQNDESEKSHRAHHQALEQAPVLSRIEEHNAQTLDQRGMGGDVVVSFFEPKLCVAGKLSAKDHKAAQEVGLTKPVATWVFRFVKTKQKAWTEEPDNKDTTHGKNPAIRTAVSHMFSSAGHLCKFSKK